MNLATIYEVAPDLSELDALQVLHLLKLSEEQGYPINQSLIERIIDRIVYSQITNNPPRQRRQIEKSNTKSLFNNLNS